MTVNFTAWTAATGALSPVQQRTFLDVLTLVAEGKSHLAHSADYRDGQPCLVNHAGHVLSVGGGNGIPTQAFSAMVGAFDDINKALRYVGVNANDGFVSPLAADFLIRNFAPLKPIQANDEQWEAAREQVVGPQTPPVGPYVEPSDEEFNDYLMTMATEVEPEADEPESLNADERESVEVERRP